MREKQDAQDDKEKGPFSVKARVEDRTLGSVYITLSSINSGHADSAPGGEVQTLHVLDDYKRRKVLARDLLAFLAFLSGLAKVSFGGR